MLKRRLGQIAWCCAVVMVVAVTLSPLHVTSPHDWTHRVCIACQILDAPATGAPDAVPARPVDVGSPLPVESTTSPATTDHSWTQPPRRGPPATLPA